MFLINACQESSRDLTAKFCGGEGACRWVYKQKRALARGRVQVGARKQNGRNATCRPITDYTVTKNGGDA